MVTPENENDIVSFNFKRKDALTLIGSVTNDMAKYKTNPILYSIYKELLKQLNAAYEMESKCKLEQTI